jgi:hypothetical protein
MLFASSTAFCLFLMTKSLTPGAAGAIAWTATSYRSAAIQNDWSTGITEEIARKVTDYLNEGSN